jgi:hypothetical protein
LTGKLEKAIFRHLGEEFSDLKKKSGSFLGSTLILCLLWKDSITSLSKLTAKCKVGIKFTIVIILLQDKRKNATWRNVASQQYASSISKDAGQLHMAQQRNLLVSRRCHVR